MSNLPDCPTPDFSIQTANRGVFNYADPSKSEITVDDIGAALSKMCRYNGHCKFFYSVAQHSLHCAEAVLEETGETNHRLSLLCLVHDATEAYICDLTSPAKHLYRMEEYRKLEAIIEKAVFEALGIPEMSDEERQLVKLIDLRMLRTEAQHVFKGGPREDLWAPVLEQFQPYDNIEICREPIEAVEQEFINTLNLLLTQCQSTPTSPDSEPTSDQKD